MSAARAEVEREYRWLPRPVLHHKCPSCGLWYVPKRRDQVWCDPSCRKHFDRDTGESRASETISSVGTGKPE